MFKCSENREWKIAKYLSKAKAAYSREKHQRMKK